MTMVFIILKGIRTIHPQKSKEAVIDSLGFIPTIVAKVIQAKA